MTDQNVFVAFERFLTTGDSNDISFTSNVYLMFSMGPYTLTNDTSNFNPRYHVFRTSSEVTTSLINCVSSKLKTLFLKKCKILTDSYC